MTSPTIPAPPAARPSPPASAGRPRGAARPAPRAAGSLAVRGVIAAACVAVTWFWWLGTPPASGATPGTALVAVAELTGLLASLLVCAQLLLVARVPWFERAVGLDRLVAWHRSLGTTVVLLVVAHVAGMIAGEALVDRATPWAALGTLLATTEDLWLALVGTVVFVAVGLTSARLARRRLSYESWYLVHLAVYGGIFLAFLHQVTAGVHFAGTPLAQAVWVALYAGTALAVVWWRAVLPLARHARLRTRVAAVVDEATGTTSVWLRGAGLDGLAARAGQFFLLRFLAAGHLATAHPYSLSAVPAGGHLRFTVGALGDHSAAVRALRPGTPVLLEGPFGHLTADRARSRRVLLVAGGAGIGPVRALAEELVAAGRDVVVVHRAHSADRLALVGEFPAVAGLRYLPIPGRREELGHDPLAPAALGRLVPDVRSRDVFVCGPPPMVEAVVRSVRALGVPRSAVHTEELSLA